MLDAHRALRLGDQHLAGRVVTGTASDDEISTLATDEVGALIGRVEVDERLSRLAAATGRSKSYYLRELVTAGIDDLEYAYGLVAHAEAIRAGRARDPAP